MDMKLLQKLTLAVLPPDAHPKISPLFEGMLAHPGANGLIALQSMLNEIHEDTSICGPIIVGWVTAIACAHGSDDPLFREGVLHAIEGQRKAKGENVINFHIAKTEVKS